MKALPTAEVESFATFAPARYPPRSPLRTWSIRLPIHPSNQPCSKWSISMRTEQAGEVFPLLVSNLLLNQRGTPILVWVHLMKQLVQAWRWPPKSAPLQRATLHQLEALLNPSYPPQTQQVNNFYWTVKDITDGVASLLLHIDLAFFVLFLP